MNQGRNYIWPQQQDLNNLGRANQCVFVQKYFQKGQALHEKKISLLDFVYVRLLLL
jgi:hypothetical protein